MGLSFGLYGGRNSQRNHITRPLRIEYAGALYHVTSRGNARGNIYHDENDRKTFTDILAILVDKEHYLLELSRYVVLNPVRARLVQLPEQWPWGSYRATAGLAKVPEFLMVDWILSLFGANRKGAQSHYRTFVCTGIQNTSPWLNFRREPCFFALLGDYFKIVTISWASCLLFHSPMDGFHRSHVLFRDIHFPVNVPRARNGHDRTAGILPQRVDKSASRGQKAREVDHPREVFVRKHQLSNPQAKTLGHILKYTRLTIQDFEVLCPKINRQSLQRDLKFMVEIGLLVSKGETNKLAYRMKGVG